MLRLKTILNGLIPTTAKLRGGKLLLFVFILLMSPLQATASSGNVLVVGNGKTSVYQKVYQALEQDLNRHCGLPITDCKSVFSNYKLEYQNSEEPLHITNETDLIVALGVKASKKVSSLQLDLPIIHALISRSSFLSMEQHGHGTYVFLDQPLERHFALARSIHAEPKMGVLLGPTSGLLIQEMKAKAGARNIQLTHRTISHEEQVGPLLKEVLEGSNMLLALPDPVIFNRRTIFNILLSSYHNKIPVIGFSAAYVKAGALIAVYSSPEDIARHLGDLVRTNHDAGKGTLPASVYPKYFSVAINRSVARSLEISLPEEDDIIRQITDEFSQ